MRSTLEIPLQKDGESGEVKQDTASDDQDNMHLEGYGQTGFKQNAGGREKTYSIETIKPDEIDHTDSVQKNYKIVFHDDSGEIITTHHVSVPGGLRGDQLKEYLQQETRSSALSLRDNLDGVSARVEHVEKDHDSELSNQPEQLKDRTIPGM